MSPVHVMARRPCARTCSAVLSTSRHPAFFSSSGNVARSRPVPVTTTSAPSSARATAVARPIPRIRPAPVTTATLPSSVPMRSCLHEVRRSTWSRARSGLPAAGVAKLLVASLDAVLDALRPRLGAVRAERLAMGNREHVVLERALDGAPMPLHVHRLVHRRLGELEREWILERDPLRQLERGTGELVALDHAVHEAQVERRLRVDVVAGEQVLLRLPRRSEEHTSE